MNISRLFSFILLLSIASPCLSQKYEGPGADIKTILKNTDAFSRHYMKGDYEAMANAYTTDGKIFPTGAKIIEGREAIRRRWVLPEGVSIAHHKVSPSEIKILGDHAYDLGYYEGITKNKDGTETSWKGKYVIVWKKVEGEWKIYLDIWNRVNEEE